MPLLGDIAMLFIHFRTLFHIWTNLLTQCTPVLVSVFGCFCISGFPLRELPEKSRKNYIKNQRSRSFPAPTAGGGPPGLQAPWWRGPPPGHAEGAPGPPRSPLMPPFGIYLYRVPKPSRWEPFFAISSMFRRRRASKIGSTRRTLPGTLPEGRITTGSFSTTMDASRMSCE